MLIAAASAVCALLASPGTVSQEARVSVLVVGTDGLAAGLEQRVLEALLATQDDARLVPSEEIAAALGKPKGALSVSVAVQKGEAAALDLAVAAYYDGRIDESLALLAKLEQLQDARVGVGTGERRRLRLWRAVALLAKGDRIQAEVEVRSALAMDPDLQADLRVFPPSLREVVDAARTRGIPKVRVTLDGLPKGATIYADERPVGTTFNVPAGRHWVWATAKGFRAVETRFETDREITVPLALPLLVDDASVRGFVFEGGPLPLDVAAALERSKLDAIVVAADRGKERSARLVRAGGAVEAGPVVAAADPSSLREWIATRSAATAAEVVAARLAELRSTWTASFVVGAATVVDERRLSGNGSAPGATSFTGAGPELRVDAARGIWVARASGSWTSFALSPYQVSFPDGRVRLVNGGERARVHAALGGRWIFGPGDAEFWPTAGLLAGITHVDHRADRLSDDRGDLGLFPSHVRQRGEVRAIGGVPLRTRAGVLRLDLEAALAVYETLRESPRATGRDPRPSGGTEAHAHIRWLPRSGSFQASIGYRLESGRDSFSGRAAFPGDPPLRDATSDRRTQTFVLEAGRRF